MAHRILEQKLKKKKKRVSTYEKRCPIHIYAFRRKTTAEEKEKSLKTEQIHCPFSLFVAVAVVVVLLLLLLFFPLTALDMFLSTLRYFFFYENYAVHHAH